MKKLLAISLSIMFVLSVILTGCGGSKPVQSSQPAQSSKPAASAPAAKEVTLKLGHVVDDNHVWHKAALKFGELVAQKTNGSVKIQVFSNSQIGNDRDMAEGMQMGSVDMALIAGVLGNFYEGIQLLEMPYLFENQEHLKKVIYGPVGEEIKKNLQAKAGIIGLEFWERGPRQLTTSKPVNSIQDIQGLKIRVPEIPPMVSAWKAMGANPTPMAWGEVYTALQQHTIDAQENPFANILSGRINEVNKFMALTNHVYGYVMHVMSEKSLSKLTADQQKAIKEAAAETMKWQNEQVAKDEGALLKQLQDKGMTVTKPDVTEFKNKARSTHAEFANKFGKELYEKIINAAK